ncbi:MAG: hypothetical protein Q4A19_00645 [Johnsonella sp.]|nr:hypothetical protein [Johnsonella sp.]
MEWYQKLYLGENARKNPELILKIKKGKPVLSAYLLILKEEGGGLLDIVHNIAFFHSLYRNMEPGMLILGVGIGKQDAMRLARDIIEEVYSATGGFDLSAYFNSN